MQRRFQVSGLAPDLSIERRARLFVIAAVTWLSFTCALALWWMLFGLKQIESLRQLALGQGTLSPPSLVDGAVASEFQAPSSVALLESLSRQHTMLLAEGSVLLALLVVGGFAIIWGIRREALNSIRFREFFAAFSHDLKTALASLRLQADVLTEPHSSNASGSSVDFRKPLGRLKSDVARIQAQLENALFVAGLDSSDRARTAHPISIDEVRELCDLFQDQIRIEFTEAPSQVEATRGGQTSSHARRRVKVDRTEFEIILNNLILNAVKHGRADSIRLLWNLEKMDIPKVGESVICKLAVQDNGRGFHGDTARLGEKFYRPTPESGSGLGLFLIRNLLESRGGSLQVVPAETGFRVELSIPVAPDSRSSRTPESGSVGQVSR